MKNKRTAGILAILLGSLGVHRFYLGQILLGIVYLVFAPTGIPFILGIIDGIIFLTKSQNEFDGKYNLSPNTTIQHRTQRQSNPQSQNQDLYILITKGIQVLESLHIIETSKNIETIESRLDFLLGVNNDMHVFKLANSQAFAHGAESAMERYLDMYYDRVPSNQHQDYLINPENLTRKFDVYKAKSMAEGFSKHYFSELDQIENLKTSKGKLNRFLKLQEKANQINQKFGSLLKNTDEGFDLKHQVMYIEKQIERYITV